MVLKCSEFYFNTIINVLWRAVDVDKSHTSKFPLFFNNKSG